MKIFAINGSPNVRGNTMLILSPFLEGAREAGAAVELFHISKLKINPCRGEFNCWFKTPGECFQKDDMQTLYPKLREADVWVFASPLYAGGISGILKMFLDRIIPLIEPFIEKRRGRSRHPLRPGVKKGSIVFISNCGLWEMENFDAVMAHLKEICGHADRNFGGALLRPHGPLLPEMLKCGKKSAKKVVRAAKEAGRQIVLAGKISPETEKEASRALVPRFLYNFSANRRFKKILGRP